MRMDSCARHTLAGVVLVAGAAMSMPDASASIVTNGGFEAGDFSGWTQSGDTAFTGVDGFAPHSGDYAAFVGSIGGTTLSQTLSTVAGATYQVEFWLQLLQDDLSTSFSWAWDNTTQMTLSNAPSFGYTAFSATVTASGASTTLAFSFVNAPGFFDFDDVSVTQVPEPASLGLALAGVGLLAAGRIGRRRR